MVKRGRGSRFFTAVLGLLVATTATFLAVVPVTAATPSATLTVTPQTPTVSPSGHMTMSVVVQNNSGKQLTGLEVHFSALNNLIATAADLDAWLSGKNGGALPGKSAGVVAIANIDSGRSITTAFDIPASALGSSGQWGVHGVAAQLTSSNTALSSARTSVVLLAGSAPRALKLTTIVPMSAKPSTLGLVPKEELAASTATTGYLAELLAASRRYEVAVAVDPKISTSILSEGGGAPSSAAAWLADLSRTARDGFWLSYGDSDVMGQIQAGAPAPVVPDVTDLSGLTPVVPTPTPTNPTPNESQAPAWAGWSPSISDIVWPVANSVASEADLNKLRTINYRRVLLSSGNVSAATFGQTRVQVGAWPAAVVNDYVSSCLGAAQRAESQITFDTNISCVISYLAATATDPQAQSAVVASLSRIMPSLTALSNPSDLLAELYTQPWIHPQKLSALLAMPSSSSVIAPRPEASSRISSIRSMQANQAELLKFSAVTTSPEVVTNPGERRLAAVLSGGWSNTDAWLGGLATNTALTNEVLNAVSIVTSSPINMVGGQARIPVVIRNGLNAPVNIIVQAEPNNGRLVVDGNVALTVEANSQNRAYIPVSARVGSGSVDLKITLTDTAGNAIGSPQTLPVRVRADWEVWGLLGIGIIFIGLVTAGVIRTARKRKGHAHD